MDSLVPLPQLRREARQWRARLTGSTRAAVAKPSHAPSSPRLDRYQRLVPTRCPVWGRGTGGITGLTKPLDGQSAVAKSARQYPAEARSSFIFTAFEEPQQRPLALLSTVQLLPFVTYGIVNPRGPRGSISLWKYVEPISEPDHTKPEFELIDQVRKGITARDHIWHAAPAHT